MPPAGGADGAPAEQCDDTNNQGGTASGGELDPVAGLSAADPVAAKEEVAEFAAVHEHARAAADSDSNLSGLCA